MLDRTTIECASCKKLIDIGDGLDIIDVGENKMICLDCMTSYIVCNTKPEDIYFEVDRSSTNKKRLDIRMIFSKTVVK